MLLSIVARFRGYQHRLGILCWAIRRAERLFMDKSSADSALGHMRSIFALLFLLVACGATRLTADFTSAEGLDANGYEVGTRCGSWQNAYSKLHRSILSSEQPGRYAVAVAAHTGLSDRLVGLVTVFMYALLTDRAFHIAGSPLIFAFSIINHSLRRLLIIILTKVQFLLLVSAWLHSMCHLISGVLSNKLSAGA